MAFDPELQMEWYVQYDVPLLPRKVIHNDTYVASPPQSEVVSVDVDSTTRQSSRFILNTEELASGRSRAYTTK